MRLYHLWNTLQGVNEVLTRKFRVRSQLTVIIGIVDTLLPFHKEAVHRTVEQVFGSTLCLDHYGKTINFTDFVVLAFGAYFFVYLLQTGSNGLDIGAVFYTFDCQFIYRCTFIITLHTLLK